MALDNEEIINIRRAASKAGVKMETAVQNYLDIRRDPEALLQPGQKGYESSKYVKHQIKQKVERDKKRDNEIAENEDKDKYEKRMKSIDKVHKKYCLVP